MNSKDSLWWLLPAATLAVPVYATDYLSTRQAQHILFPAADSVFVPQPLAFDKKQRKQIKKLAGVRQNLETQPVWQVQENGGTVGWYIEDDVIGKHEFITYACAIDNHGEVIGIEILSYRETHGGEIREQEWRDHFKGKSLADPFKLNKDVPNISGATLSSRNVLDGVKRLLVIHQNFLDVQSQQGG